MIEETAIVIEVRGQQVLLETQRKNVCQSCSVKSGCGTSTLAKVVGKRSSQFIVDKIIELQAGDQVIVGVEDNALVQSSLLIYLLPLIFMLSFGTFAELVFTNEFITILTSITGLLVSVIFIRLILHKSRLKKAIQPHLIRRIS